jgi:hypothetical protein
MHNCPQPGKWAISVWDGADGTETGEALAACGADAVDVAYALDPQTGGWLGWFRGRPEISKLLTLNGKQGVLALGRIGAPPPTPTPEPTPGGGEGAMYNCPQAGKWAISVWDGPDGTEAGQALATCGEGTVDFAYYLDPATNGWLGYFDGQPQLSKLLTLDGMHGVLAHGAVGAPPPSPTPTPMPTPGGPEVETWSGTTSQGKPIEFYIVEDSPGSRAINRVTYDVDGICVGAACTCRVGPGWSRLDSPAPIVGNAFSYQGSSFDISGRFDSPTTASGEFHFHTPYMFPAPGCDSGPLTWTASLH